jgi:hypothetical protein
MEGHPTFNRLRIYNLCLPAKANAAIFRPYVDMIS